MSSHDEREKQARAMADFMRPFLEQLKELKAQTAELLDLRQENIDLRQELATTADQVKQLTATLGNLRESSKGMETYLAQVGGQLEKLAADFEAIQLEKGPPGEPGEPGTDGRDGRPGRGIKSAFLDREGQLVQVFDDGDTQTLGIVVGRDGKDGINGKDGAPGIRGEDGADGRDGADGEDGAPGIDGKDGKDGIDGKDGKDGENGKDGADGLDGKDGADGLGFDELRFEYDGERTLTAIMERGLKIREQAFVLPIPIYRGVWKAGAYALGDSVTRSGSIWISQTADNTDIPNGTSDSWKLAVKEGRPGKTPKAPKKPDVYYTDDDGNGEDEPT